MATETGSPQPAAGLSPFGSEINSLSNGDAVQSSIAVANFTGLDEFMEVSISIGSIVADSGAEAETILIAAATKVTCDLCSRAEPFLLRRGHSEIDKSALPRAIPGGSIDIRRLQA